MKRFFSRLKHWIKTHRTQSIAIGGGLLVVLWMAGAYTIYALSAPVAPPLQPIPKPKPEVKHYSPLTGVKVKDEKATEQAVTAIMIENSPDARPHSGLKQAGVVYEAIAEGGITRYLALYQEAKPGLIGPVRSLREYFVDWLTPYQASVVHVGGSSQALKLVRNGKYRDIDQFFYPQAYWRASDRYAPHNVYTNFEKLDALNREKGYKSSSFKSFPRTDPKAVKEPDATNITVNFSSSQYNTIYRYDKKSNAYNRHLAGAPHKDREKGIISPRVVVALRVDESTVMQDGLREVIKTSGKGQATVFQNGTAIKATWRKSSRNAPLELLDSAGKPIELARGQTWIAAVPNGRGAVSW